MCLTTKEGRKEREKKEGKRGKKKGGKRGKRRKEREKGKRKAIYLWFSLHFTALRYRTTSLYLGRKTEGEKEGEGSAKLCTGQIFPTMSEANQESFPHKRHCTAGHKHSWQQETAGNKFLGVTPRLSQLWQNQTRGCLSVEFFKWTGLFGILDFLEYSPLKSQNTFFWLSSTCHEEKLFEKSTCKTCRVYGNTEMSHSSRLFLVLRHSKGFEKLPKAPGLVEKMKKILKKIFLLCFPKVQRFGAVKIQELNY